MVRAVAEITAVSLFTDQLDERVPAERVRKSRPRA